MCLLGTRDRLSVGGLELIGPPTCDNEYEVEVIPVTVGEE
jgi:hypothetical protein